MNGETKKQLGLALVSFAAGAVLAGVFGNPKAREKLAEGSRKLFRRNEE